MPKLFVLMGKSATGKDTIYKELLKIDRLELKEVVIYTTRPIREGEKDGIEYFFVSNERLRELKEEGKIIEIREYNTVHGIWSYFTVDDGQIDLDKHNSLIIGTLESYEQIRNYYGRDKVYPIYIETDDGVRLQRALDREKLQETPRFAEMCRRYLADEEDFSEENLKKLGINKRYYNFELASCVKEIVNDIKLISKDK
ncbi:MAG: guanylate kinase [Clostridiales bacterium]|nr:guanylate kinase [Clostridiales bacterium]